MHSSAPEFIPEATPDDPLQANTLDLRGRSHQISPVFNDAELERLQRYGKVRHFADGDTLFQAGISVPSLPSEIISNSSTRFNISRAAGCKKLRGLGLMK